MDHILHHLHFNQYKVPVVATDLEEGVFGEFSFYYSPKISISLGLSKDIQTSTILHEVIEMISEVYGLELEESTVRTLEVSLMGVFLQNPWFVALLQKGAEKPFSATLDWPASQNLPDSPEAL